MPASLSRVREAGAALFIEVTEGGAEGPPHWAEHLSMQDEEHPWLAGTFAPPVSSCLDTQVRRYLLSEGRKVALGNTFAM